MTKTRKTDDIAVSRNERASNVAYYETRYLDPETRKTTAMRTLASRGVEVHEQLHRLYACETYLFDPGYPAGRPELYCRRVSLTAA